MKIDVDNISGYLKDQNNAEIILSHIDTNISNPNSKMSVLSALLKLTGDDIFKEPMTALRSIISAEYAKKEAKPNDITMDSLKELHASYLHEFTNYRQSIDVAQKVLMSGLMTGVYDGLPPRRLDDYIQMLLHDTDDNYNHFKDGRTKMRFNVHKNSHRDSSKTVELDVPEPLRPVVEYLASITPKQMFLFTNRQNKQFSEPGMSNMLTRILGGSCNAIRSRFLSEKYQNVPDDLLQTASDMGHSFTTAVTFYVKKL